MFTVCIIMSAGILIIVTITLVRNTVFITLIMINIFRKYGEYDHNSDPYEPEVDAAIFSAVVSLVGLVVVVIMFTNKIIIISKNSADRGKLEVGTRMTIEQSVINSHGASSSTRESGLDNTGFNEKE